MTENENIVQLIPAQPNWWAQFTVDGAICYEPIVAYALVESVCGGRRIATLSMDAAGQMEEIGVCQVVHSVGRPADDGYRWG